MKKRRILFLGETYRADAITWINGLKEFGYFEIVVWQLQTKSTGTSRLKRLFELLKTILTFKKIVKQFNADMVIAERTTSYGFLAAISGIKPIAIAQQGITDLWPENSILYPFKKLIQKYAFRKANIIHAWGDVMTISMKKKGVDMNKVMVLPKGINLEKFKFEDNSQLPIIKAIVTRSLFKEYNHDIILKAFGILIKKNIPFQLTIVGDGPQLNYLQKLSHTLGIHENVVFTGKINNDDLPKLLQKSNFYISMPSTEGVSASLFEAMATGCFPIVSNLPGNACWLTDKKNGFLIPLGDYKKLAVTIESIFQDNNFQKKAIAENRKLVEEKADYKINMQTIAQSYHQLIDNHTF
jgi:glycosyltransferase involved in cell wall biosynthesis